jgi:hypothetical protein
MFTEQDVAELRAALDASEVANARQFEELAAQSARVQQFESRTPRPDWPSLMHGSKLGAVEVQAGGVASKAAVQASTQELAASLAARLGTYASELQVPLCLTESAATLSCLAVKWHA